MHEAGKGIAFGTWAWSNNKDFGSIYAKKELREAFMAGRDKCLFWDSAWVYGDGAAEECLGEFMKGFPQPVSAKFTPGHAPEGENKVLEALQRDLELLGVKRLDWYWLHNPSGLREILPLFKEPLNKGLIERVGLSNVSLSQLREAVELAKELGIRIRGVQNHYSIVRRAALDDGTLLYCLENDIDFFPYMIFEQGALTGKYDRVHPFPEGSDRAKNYDKQLGAFFTLGRTIDDIAEKKNCSRTQLLIAEAAHHGMKPLVGITKASHADEAYEALNIILSEEDVRILHQAADESGIRTKRVWEYLMKDQLST